MRQKQMEAEAATRARLQAALTKLLYRLRLLKVLCEGEPSPHGLAAGKEVKNDGGGEHETEGATRRGDGGIGGQGGRLEERWILGQ